MEKIPAVTFVAGLDDTVPELYVSPQIEAPLGFSQEEWIENPLLWYRQLHPDDRHRWAVEFANTCGTGAPFRSDYRLVGATAAWYGFTASARSFRTTRVGRDFCRGLPSTSRQAKTPKKFLRRSHEDLEARVHLRTAELAESEGRLARLLKRLLTESLQSMKTAA